jgi:membrane-associated phospholipid phosphatase
VWQFVALLLLAACSDNGPSAPRFGDESTAGSWRTFVLANSAEFRPAPPPSDNDPQTKQELDEIVGLQAQASASNDSLVQAWNVVPTRNWHEKTLELLNFYWPLLPEVRYATPVRSTRVLSLVNVAMYDAMVAAWDAKYAYKRHPPAVVDSRVHPLVDIRAVPSYPSEHAAAAAAAAAVLSYLFPSEDTLSFHRMEHDAGEARILAGVAYRTDVDAGYTIGRAVAQRIIARATVDGSDTRWDSVLPTEQYTWQPTPPKRVAVPFDPTAGIWRTWVIANGSLFRPDPPPLPGSARFTADLAELLTLSTTRTTEQADTARYWATEAPSSRWEVFMEDEITRHGLGPMHSARALALASVAMHDAMVACWDAKFHYWLERPITADTAIRTAFSTPPFPSYPSGHSTQSAAAAEVFAYLFPDMADYYHAKAHEASRSRVLAGIHYRFDIEAGEALGAKVGDAVVEWAKTTP